MSATQVCKRCGEIMENNSIHICKVEVPRVDAWRDRSTLCCKTCMWWVMKGWGRSVVDRDDGTEPVKHAQGRCRRHAPTLAGYPAVYWDDWCGDHKLHGGWL